MAQKVLHKQGLLPQILSFAGKNCEDLSDGYRNCRPPFRYKNSATGETRDCARACYEHAAEWIGPLLQTLPTRAVSGDESVRIPTPKEQYFVVSRGYKMDGTAVALIDVLDAAEDPREANMRRMRSSLGKATFFPDSIRETAKQAAVLMNESKKGAVLQINLPETETATTASFRRDIRFPGNEGWNHFRRFVKPIGPNGLSLRLSLTRD